MASDTEIDNSGSDSSLALKEWAITQLALDRGEQIVLLRKGGIREEDNEFRLRGSEFLLYPTYDHQREELVKPAWRDELRRLAAEPRNAGEIRFSHWARVEHVAEVREKSAVAALSQYYIWTAEYAEARLDWKPRSPLLVLLVRVHRLEKEQTVPFHAAYAGCTSLVNLAAPVSLDAPTPVLSDAEFSARAARCLELLRPG